MSLPSPAMGTYAQMGGFDEFPTQSPYAFAQMNSPFYDESQEVPQMAPHMYPLQRPQMMPYDNVYPATQAAHHMYTGAPSQMGTSSIYNMRKQNP